MYNLHSLLILCFMVLAVVFEAIFTEAIYIILKTNSLHRLLVGSLVCFGPLWPYLARSGVLTPRHILPMHLRRSWICPVQQESPPYPKISWEVWRLSHPKVTFCHPHVNCYYGSPSVTWKGGAIYTHRDPRTYTQRHAGVGEMANYPLCECVHCGAMHGRSMQLSFVWIEKK